MQPSWVRSESSALIERDIWLDSLPFLCWLKIQSAREWILAGKHPPCSVNMFAVNWTLSLCGREKPQSTDREILDSHGGDAEVSSLWWFEGVWLQASRSIVSPLSSNHSYGPTGMEIAASRKSEYCVWYPRRWPSVGRNMSQVAR